MLVGIPKEIKNNENRISMTPSAVHALKKAGHTILVESGAGEGSGFGNPEYENAGAFLLKTAEEVWNRSEMIVKVKEPVSEEYRYLREELILFTYLHLAPNKPLSEALISGKTTGIAYETVQTPGKSLPLLIPMSEIAGRLSVQVGAYMLMKYNGGRGLLLGGAPGVLPAEVVIGGGGTVGMNAARIAAGLGARVTVLDINHDRLAYMEDIFVGRVATLYSTEYNLAEATAKADLYIGAVLVPGARAPRIVTEGMVRNMKKGSVIVDVAIDQGGSVETIDRVTTHDRPCYEKHGIVHYAVANMPGAVPRTSTLALSGATLPYILKLASQGAEAALRNDASLLAGLNTYQGSYTCKAVADSMNSGYVPALELLGK